MTSVPVLAAPKQLGKYEVGAKIGGGGMATVYIGRATLDDGTEERVALKVIRDELANDEEFKSMFVDEAKILARLSHPNVIRTLEYGVTGHHRFIAMELLSGRTFYDVWDLLVARNARLSPELSAWICARIADGLHAAHELLDESGEPLGVIHRDVNPGNIFVTHAGEAKLIDFGLAKARVRLSKSADGIVKGKIPYLAPEQAHGRPIDRRIDVYALGATLWESVTMKRLFKRDTDIETLRAIREAKIPDVRGMVSGFPSGLWSIIEKSLRHDRDARYATADELRVELDAFVAAEKSTEEIKAELVATLSLLFPGQRAQQATWERAATSSTMPIRTMPPPAPVPVVSATLLEADDDPIASEEIAVAAPPSGSRVRDVVGAEAAPLRTPGAIDPPETLAVVLLPAPSKPKLSRAAKSRAKSKKRRTAKKQRKSSGNTRSKDAFVPRAIMHVEAQATPSEAAANWRPLWVTLVIVGAAFVALALALANR